MIKEPSMDQAFLEKLTEVVEENLENHLFGVEELSREAGMSRSKIHRRLHKITGQSTSQFIRELRLQHALKMLQNELGTASEISYRVGFGSPNYFSKCFHEYYSFPPSEAVHQEVKETETPLIYNREADSVKSGKIKYYLTYPVTAFLLLIIIMISGYYFYHTRKVLEEVPVERTSIAVLPLHNLTGDQNQAYFVDGLHDALIGELARLSDLRVISRTSTLPYRDANNNIKEIASQLGVDHLIEGSVYRTEDNVRIQLQLIQTEPVEQHIWAEHYERNTSDILSLLSEVTRTVAQTVHVSLTPEEETLLADRREVNPEAYKAYLRGTYLLNQYTPESYREGISLLLEATRIDPGDPLPWARLALGYNTAGHGIAPPPDVYELARAAAERALMLDNTSGEVHLSRTIVDLYETWDWEATREGFNNTFTYNPNIAEAHAHYGWFLMLEGRTPDEILNESRLAMKLDPFTPLYPVYLGFQAWWLERHDEAIEAAQKSLEIDPGYPYGYYVLGSAYAASGNFEAAIEAHKKASELNPRWKFGLGHTYALAGMEDEALKIAEELSLNPSQIDNWGLAEIFAALGEKERALHWLEASFESRFSWTPWIEWNPNFKTLRNEPRFKDLLSRMNVKSRSSLASTM
jgi:TolB-like protein/AraC-like DNA-binding protein/tetratricopeptide (TPR) repeat protein